ncbi:MAG: glycosyltransferase [Defluviitaleaceae bacterium]|nr:glycosyltransferase [Defluviitaleaceae bacterium]
MITISLCMIVKNEEDVIARCLESVKDIVDEIIIVDTGSTDKTKEIAKTFTDKVYDFEWVNHFGKARNFSFSKATKDYQMWLDADDIITEEECEKILALKKTLDPNTDVVSFKYHTHFDAAGNPTLTATRERLFKRAKNFKWNDAIHEYILMSGQIVHSDIAISHKKIGSSGDRNLKIYTSMVESGKAFSPRETYYYARELMDHGQSEAAIQQFTTFLEGGLGWFEDNIATCFNLCRCHKQLGQRDQILPILFKSFEYDTPRAEICCEIGYYYKELKDYHKAIFWFELALKLVKNSKGFILNDYWDYIPAIELCACYAQVGDFQKSFHYHQLSARYKPSSSAVAYNAAYFKKKGFIQAESLATEEES